MIGVIANPNDSRWVTEFFELFKTPWEWHVPAKQYQVVITADGRTQPANAALAIMYGAAEHPIDRRVGVTVEAMRTPACVRWGTEALPVQGPLVGFRGRVGATALSLGGSAVDYHVSVGRMMLRRIGLNLFEEVSRLLSAGQPGSSAHIPTLEQHVALVRQSLCDADLPFIEVPPRPEGAEFICCLTHDVDFFGLRRHFVDRTLAGFALRGTFGTARDFVRGRRPLDEALRNWAAVASLPAVFLGLKPDPWNPFEDYAKADRGRRSTFFVVPFKNQPGTAPDGTVPQARRVAYGIRDIQSHVRAAAARKSEIALHGIDAWRDTDAGQVEKAELEATVVQQRTGVRMHWLYFSPDTPRQLEQAGFDYDSTCGYNETVGFKAGTLQAFRLPGTANLLELPLSIMDSAMFYPDHLGLSREQAAERCADLVRQARRCGGALVINWHDRSLAPERQWGRMYASLLDDVEQAGGWFATAGDAVQWFRWRRSVQFAETATGGIAMSASERPCGLPPARVVVRRPGRVEERLFGGGSWTLNV